MSHRSSPTPVPAGMASRSSQVAGFNPLKVTCPDGSLHSASIVMAQSHPLRAGRHFRLLASKQPTWPCEPPERDSQLPPATAPNTQAVLEQLLARVSKLKFCQHDPDGFAMWISTPPRSAALQVLLLGNSGTGPRRQLFRPRRAGRRPRPRTRSSSPRSPTGLARTSTCAAPAQTWTWPTPGTRLTRPPVSAGKPPPGIMASHGHHWL